MKKALFACMALATAFAATSCQNDEELLQKELPQEPTNGPMVITGKATATINGKTIDVNWVQLWENGPKFAEYNVGATSVTDYGGYYCWGMTIDHDSNRDYNNSESVLSGADDTVTALWGNNWRMPTKAELQELLSYCDVQWTNVGGVNGRKFTGRGDYASNSVFFPAAGYCCIGYAYGQGNVGYYWSSTPDGSGYAYDLYFYPDFQYVLYDFSFYGFSVRAVLKETVK